MSNYDAATALTELRGWIARRGFEDRHVSGNEQGKGDDSIETGYVHGQVSAKVYENGSRRYAFKMDIGSDVQMNEVLDRLETWMVERGHLAAGGLQP